VLAGVVEADLSTFGDEPLDPAVALDPDVVLDPDDVPPFEVDEMSPVAVVLVSTVGVGAGEVPDDELVPPDAASLIAEVVSLTVFVAGSVAVDVAPESPPAVWSRRASADDGTTRPLSSATTIAIATEVPLPLSRLRIRNIPCEGRFGSGPTTYGWVENPKLR
jgi:hypothetical protein